MIVAKLSTGKIVQFLDGPKAVRFADGLHVLVCDRLTAVRSRIDPYWVPSCLVVWQIDFADKN